ncbi:MAG: hypothetical protein GY803_02320 [Chloroflexi bacterium]|nr:hypothetical protein [Chloroflexota bacterium]
MKDKENKYSKKRRSCENHEEVPDLEQYFEEITKSIRMAAEILASVPQSELHEIRRSVKLTSGDPQAHASFPDRNRTMWGDLVKAAGNKLRDAAEAVEEWWDGIWD